MNVRDLMEMLSEFDPELEVQFAYNYGDHWRTIVTGDVNNVSLGKVEYSEYHRMDKFVSDDDFDEDEDDNKSVTRKVVILD